MNRVFFQLALIAAAMLPVHANAAYECNVSVRNVLVYSGGLVNIYHNARGDYTMLCNLSADYNGVSANTCTIWTAMLLAIKKKNGTASFYYNGTGSCATMLTYTDAPVPVYIADVTP
jgi:hypothetical protein